MLEEVPVGTKATSDNGYVMVKLSEDDPYYPMVGTFIPEIPGKLAGEGWVSEHRLVMAQHLGRCLKPGERVYRLNRDRADNRIENLTLTVPARTARVAYKAIRARHRENR